MTNLPNSLGERLRQARLAKGLTQDQVAALISKTTTAYGHYERDRNEMSREIAQKLSGILGISTDWLFTGSGNMEDGDDDFLEIMAKIKDKDLKADILKLALKGILKD